VQILDKAGKACWGKTQEIITKISKLRTRLTRKAGKGALRHSAYDTQHNDTQHNDTQHNDTQRKGLVNDPEHK